MADKKTVDIPLPFGARLLLSFVKFSDKYFPLIAQQIILSQFYHPIRFTQNQNYPPIFKQAKEFELSISKQKVIAYSWGKGPLVLLCHGWSGWAGQMGEFVEPLLAKGFRVVAFDGPAHGRSSGKRTTQIDFVECVRNIEKRYGPIVAMVGHSFGGVCTLMALKEGIKIPKAVIIGTPASLPEMIEETRKKFNVSEKTISIIPQNIKHRTGKDYHEFSAEHIAQFVNIPILVIHDKDDVDVSFENAHTLSNIIKQSSLLITNGKGHRRILRDSEVIQKVVEYVSQIPN